MTFLPAFVRRSAPADRRVPRFPFPRLSFAGARRRHVWPLACPAALLALLEPVAAQQLPEGLAASVQALAPTTTQALATPAGLVTFDGTTVALTAPGQSPQVLFTAPGAFFGSFLLQTDPTHVLLGYTGFSPFGANDAIWHVPLQGPPPAQPLAMAPFNYDAAMLTTTTVVLSARTGGFGAPDNELLVLDLGTGATQLLATVPGASGPVAVASNGDVFTANGFAGWPPVGGTASVLRFPRGVVDSAIATTTTLGLADAQLVMAGLDAVSDFAFDDDGDLLFVDWFNDRVSEISDAVGLPWFVPVVVDHAAGPLSATTVQFVPGAGTGVLEPFQPANGTLLVHETDYAAASQLRAVRTAAPVLTASGGAVIGAGPFDLVVTGGPSLGLGVVAFAFGSAAGTTPVVVPGFEQPLWLSTALQAAPILVVVPFDVAGQLVLSPTNPGFAPPLAAVTQVACVSTLGVLGATAPVPLLLGP